MRHLFKTDAQFARFTGVSPVTVGRWIADPSSVPSSARRLMEVMDIIRTRMPELHAALVREASSSTPKRKPKVAPLPVILKRPKVAAPKAVVKREVMPTPDDVRRALIVYGPRVSAEDYAPLARSLMLEAWGVLDDAALDTAWEIACLMEDGQDYARMASLVRNG